MVTLPDLQNEKKQILSNISKAANEGNSDLVLLESEKLEKIENLIFRQTQIISELEELKIRTTNSPIQALNNRQVAPKKVDKVRSSLLASSRELGNEIRMKFLRKVDAAGIKLHLVKGKTIYRTQSGKRVGIAVATERQPNRWFLGLPVGGFDQAVLLCEREDGEVIEILLPEEFFMKYGQAMSQSKGQLKFNIVNRSNSLLVQVPGTDGISSASFASDSTFLL